VTSQSISPVFLDAGNRDAVERYVLARSLVGLSGLPVEVSSAGAGNMNLVLRVTPATGKPFIVKQGRPWVEKYKQIPAPPERTLVEAMFYDLVKGDPRVADRMPAVLGLDRTNHVLMLEDLGHAGDFTWIYADGAIPVSSVSRLLEWLNQLARIAVPPEARMILANRAMRALNHEHMFSLPLRAENGFDLDAITPGLRDAARDLIADSTYTAAVGVAGRRYLDDGSVLVHGDYFPGSWLMVTDGVRVIDPEFCFLGDPEFDCGILAAHLTIANCGPAILDMVTASAEERHLDLGRLATYAGVEIMRRLIGVAQLPIAFGIHTKRALLERSRRLVVEPQKGLS
jgi:5-methylthioribose kinase